MWLKIKGNNFYDVAIECAIFRGYLQVQQIDYSSNICLYIIYQCTFVPRSLCTLFVTNK